MKFVFRGDSSKQFNDSEIDQLFELNGYRYTFNLKPNTLFWRFGLRLTWDRRGFSSSREIRYNNTDIKHIELCAGVVENNSWVKPNVVQLQQYHLNDVSTFHACSQYEPQSMLILTIESLVNGLSRISYSAGTCDYTRDIDLRNHQFFKIAAWADNVEFEMECGIDTTFVPYDIKLSSVKALTSQSVEIRVEKLGVVFGKNNSGKTSILVGACNAFMDNQNFTMDYLGPNRLFPNRPYDYSLEGEFEHHRIEKQKEGRKTRCENLAGQHQNFDWMVELALQDDVTRTKVVEWFSSHFEKWNFTEVMTGKYVSGVSASVNDRDPLDQGVGARAALPIIIQLFNPNVSFLAIDEPELGLEPHTQKIIFRAIKDATEGINGFPMKRVLLATHSHLFLDKETVQNNFRVEKLDGAVSATQLQSSGELQESTYKLLGNNPSDLFFPSNIVVVEGISDRIFLNQIYLQLLASGKLRRSNIVFHYLEGFDKVKVGLEAIVQMLKTQTYIPIYATKICALFDFPGDKGYKTIEKIRAHFGDTQKKRFVVLDKTAIEYFFPLRVVNSVFDSHLTPELFQIEVENFLKSISKEFPFEGRFMDRRITKRDLSTMIANKLDLAQDLQSIDDKIIGLLTEADALAFG